MTKKQSTRLDEAAAIVEENGTFSIWGGAFTMSGLRGTVRPNHSGRLGYSNLNHRYLCFNILGPSVEVMMSKADLNK